MQAAIVLAICFLFFCRPVYHARPHNPAPVSRFCKGINDAFAKSPDQNREKFVAVWPTDKQAKVRDCLGG